MRAARRDMQMVFQDPYSSLNPRMRVGDIVEEPLIIHGIGAKAERRAKVAELFGLVGLDPTLLARYPARVQRRPAATHRPGACACTQSVICHCRRAGLGIGCVDSGAGRSTC